MFWLLLLLFVVALALIAGGVWRKWIAPWWRIEEIVERVGEGNAPRTFLLDGATVPRRIGIALEHILLRQQKLDQQISERASGTDAIFAAMQDGLLVVDAQRRVVLANATFRNLFALGEILSGATVLETVRDATIDRLIAETLRTGETRRTELRLHDSPTDSTRHIEVGVVPTQNQSGEITGAVALFYDITQLKKLDEIRTDFVANVSHELRTPLSILRGYIETLRDNPKTSPDELARILAVMERHSKRLGHLVDDLLTLAQLESTNSNLQLGNVRIDDLFLNVVRDWEKKFAEKQLNVVVDLAPGLPMIRADAIRLQEVLYNLLDNAVKYSRAGGDIRLQAQRRDNDVALSVTDAGIGISRDDQPRIFERFYRADKARSRELGGTGLGLSIVKHIAQLHGGRVEAESELGRGTTIRLMLPVNGALDDGAVTET